MSRSLSGDHLVVTSFSQGPQPQPSAREPESSEEGRSMAIPQLLLRCGSMGGGHQTDTTIGKPTSENACGGLEGCCWIFWGDGHRILRVQWLLMKGWSSWFVLVCHWLSSWFWPSCVNVAPNHILKSADQIYSSRTSWICGRLFFNTQHDQDSCTRNLNETQVLVSFISSCKILLFSNSERSL